MRHNSREPFGDASPIHIVRDIFPHVRLCAPKVPLRVTKLLTFFEFYRFPRVPRLTFFPPAFSCASLPIRYLCCQLTRRTKACLQCPHKGLPFSRSPNSVPPLKKQSIRPTIVDSRDHASSSPEHRSTPQVLSVRRIPWTSKPRAPRHLAGYREQPK